MKSTTHDVVIIGAGMGGSTAALALASGGADILILEQGKQIVAEPDNRDTKAIFQKGRYDPQERWYDARGRTHPAGTHANFGGNTKFYGAVLSRFRERDMESRSLPGGDVPGWPVDYAEMEPWYEKAESLYRVCGDATQDPTEPWRRNGLPNPAVPDERAIAQLRERFKSAGLAPFSLPLGIDISKWLSAGKTGWDGYPDARSGKMDAETCALLPALEYDNVEIQESAKVMKLRLAGDGKRIESVIYELHGELHEARARLFVLACGAVKSSALLLSSADGGLANSSGLVGRNLMSHNSSAVIGFDRSFMNDSVYQKTFGINDFYLSDGASRPAMGNIQLLGRVTGEIMKGFVPRAPGGVLNALCGRTADFFLIGEDLPDRASRVRLRDGHIVVDRKRTNMDVHVEFIERFKQVMRSIGFSVTLHRTFDELSLSHQCGTLKMGRSGADSVVDAFGRSHDHDNLFVVDASVFVSSAAVNPALTVAALALRAAEHMSEADLRH